jgi:hypothetical protein
MEKIKAIYFSYLRAEAHYEYCVQFRDMLDASPQVQSVVAMQYPAFVECLAKEGELLNEMQKSDYTAQIAEADHRVDRCITGMNALIEAALHHFDHTTVEAARSLHNRFQAFGYISKKSYEEETADVNLLLADLNSPDYLEKVNLVGMTAWVTELSVAETEFEQLLDLRYSETAQKPQGRLADARRDTEAAYRPMIDRIDASAVINDTPDFHEFIAKLNAIVTYYNDHTHRHARKNLGAGDHTVIEPIDVQHYTGRPVTVLPAVHYREEGKPTENLALGKDFDVTYKNNTDVGMAELTIHGKGAYKGTKTATFHIARP